MDDRRLTPIEPQPRQDETFGPQGGAAPLRFDFPGGRDPQSIRRRVEAMEIILERSMTLPGTNYRIGLDTVIGLVPVLGDLITAHMWAIQPGMASVEVTDFYHPDAPTVTLVLDPQLSASEVHSRRVGPSRSGDFDGFDGRRLPERAAACGRGWR